GKSAHRSVGIGIETLRVELGGRKATFEIVVGHESSTSVVPLAKTLSTLDCRSLESLRNDFQVITLCLSLFDRLLRCGISISSAGISTRTTPGALTSSENSVNHVNPVEERIDDEHQGIKESLITAKFNTKV